MSDELDEEQWDELIARLYAILKRTREISEAKNISFDAAFEVWCLTAFEDPTEDEKKRLLVAVKQTAELVRQARC